MKVEEKITLCAIKANETSHIELDQSSCRICETRICVKACPAGLYAYEPELDEIKVDHAGCLECGTCLIICPPGAVTWQTPAPGFGIRYRYG